MSSKVYIIKEEKTVKPGGAFPKRALTENNAGKFLILGLGNQNKREGKKNKRQH